MDLTKADTMINYPRRNGSEKEPVMNNKDFMKQQWVKDEIIKRLNYDPITGDLTWAEREGNDYFNKTFSGKSVGQKWTDKNDYKCHTVNIEMSGRKLSIVASRLCWLVHTGDWPKDTIDHINRDPYDNRFCNLRDVSQGVNNLNKGPYKKRRT